MKLGVEVDRRRPYLCQMPGHLVPGISLPDQSIHCPLAIHRTAMYSDLVWQGAKPIQIS